MARNLHIDHCKEEKRANNLFSRSEISEVEAVDDNEGFPEEDYARLEHSFAALSIEQKEIIVLSRYQGLKYEEISAITNQSVSAIKVTIHRALKQLRGIYFKQI